MAKKESPMRADDISKKALELYGAERLLETGQRLAAKAALHDFIAKYRPDLITKAEKQLKEQGK